MGGALALPLAGQTQRPPDLANFVVIGEGLAAGFANFSLHQVHQENSFPNLMARQMGVRNFPQPLFQAPGLGNVPGFPGLPARVPGNLQETVRVPGGPKPTDRRNAQPPFALFVFNVSVPGMRLGEALRRRPVPPMIQATDPQQTLINMVLGFPGILTGPDRPLWTQAEYARNMNPSYALVALGYADFVDAVGHADLARLPTVAAFREDFTRVVNEIRGPGVPVAVANVPDPMDSAYASSLEAAADLVSADPGALRSYFSLNQGDAITVPGLYAIGSRILRRQSGPLPEGSVLPVSFVQAVRDRVRAINQEIAAVANQANAPLCDLAAVFASIRANGLNSGGRVLTGRYQGGLFSLSGFYPGATVQALMANACLSAINRAHGTSYPMVDVNAAVADDPVIRTIPFKRRDPREEVTE